jgi:CRP/FNR family transcriptional regulator, cyclic AMP receptor protein
MPPGARISSQERARRELALTGAPLFADMPKRHLRSIAKVTGVREYDKGPSIIREGDPGSTFYVLLDGRARVVRGGRTVTHLPAGDFFGEISLLDAGTRTANVIAESPLRCLTLGEKDFAKVLADEPVLAARVLRGVAARLRRSERSALS